jgi:putative membrane protein
MAQRSHTGIVLLLVLLLIGVLFIVPMLGMFIWGPTMGGGMMGGWGVPGGYGWGYATGMRWGFMLARVLIPLAFIGLLIVGAYLLLRPRAELPRSENPLSILDERYAKGEITSEQYSEMKKNLSKKD